MVISIIIIIILVIIQHLYSLYASHVHSKYNLFFTDKVIVFNRI